MAGARTVYRHRVPFFDTDAMGIVHHANYVRYLELSRVQFLEEHDVPYTKYLELGIHVAVTRVDVQYRSPARFDDIVLVDCWLEWVKNASLRFGYEMRLEAAPGALVAQAGTEHAAVDDHGRLTRVPRERRDHLRSLVTTATPSA